MKSKIVIFGNTRYSYMLASYIEKYCDAKVVAFTVDKNFIVDSKFYGIDVVPFENIEEEYSSDEVDFIIGIGYKDMNIVRERIFYAIKEKGYSISNFIHPGAVVETESFGEGNIVLNAAYIGQGSKIGNANIFWNGCNISHDAKIGDFNYFAPSVTSGGFVEIKNNCFFGLGSIIRDRLIVADKTCVGAGTYLNNNTEPFDVFVPAKAKKLDYKSTDMNI